MVDVCILGRGHNIVAEAIGVLHNHFWFVLLRDGQVAGRAHRHVVVDGAIAAGLNVCRHEFVLPHVCGRRVWLHDDRVRGRALSRDLQT